MIKHFIQKVHKGRTLSNPQIVICVPSGATNVEEEQLENLLMPQELEEFI